MEPNYDVVEEGDKIEPAPSFFYSVKVYKHVGFFWRARVQMDRIDIAGNYADAEGWAKAFKAAAQGAYGAGFYSTSIDKVPL